VPISNAKAKKKLLYFDVDHLLTLIDAKKESENTRKKMKKIEDERRAIEEIDMDDNGNIISKNTNNERSKDPLWVDKYTSHKFFDLLTSEATNRNVLTWLKTWDELVFPSKPKVNLKIPDYMLQKSNK
jgi:hypothetical protein